jgi:hypothetical protein
MNKTLVRPAASALIAIAAVIAPHLSPTQALWSG